MYPYASHLEAMMAMAAAAMMMALWPRI
jgi:hypothetical protein